MLVLAIGAFLSYHILLTLGQKYRANMVRFFIILMAVLVTLEQAGPSLARISDNVQEVRQDIKAVQDVGKKAENAADAAQSISNNPVLDYGTYKPTKPTFLERIFPFLGGGKFRAPVEGTITQRFSQDHQGLDIGANEGALIRAARQGKVIQAGEATNNGYGMMVLIEHSEGWQTLYAHCSKIEVEVGQNVFDGDVIALIGNTGNSTGPHLHFEIRRNGKANDPQSLLK